MARRFQIFDKAEAEGSDAYRARERFAQYDTLGDTVVLYLRGDYPRGTVLEFADEDIIVHTAWGENPTVISMPAAVTPPAARL